MARALDSAPRVYLRAFCHALLGTTFSLVPFRLSHTYRPTLPFQDSQLQAKGGGGVTVSASGPMLGSQR